MKKTHHGCYHPGWYWSSDWQQKQAQRPWPSLSTSCGAFALIATLISGAKRKNSSKKISHTYRARKYVCNWNGWRWPFHSIEGVLCCDQGLSLLKSLCYVRALIIINHRSRKKNHKYEAPRTSIIPWLMCVDPQRDSWLLILQCRCLMISACNLCLKTYCSIFCRNSSMQSRRNTRIESLSFCHAFVCL